MVLASPVSELFILLATLKERYASETWLSEGFYYICVDFNPPPLSPPRLTSQHKEVMDIPPLAKAETTSRARRNSRVRCMDQGTVGGLHTSAPAVTMSGFYYHQNSEP